MELPELSSAPGIDDDDDDEDCIIYLSSDPVPRSQATEQTADPDSSLGGAAESVERKM